MSQELSQEEYKFGEEYFFEILDRGGKAYIGINTRINEFLIQPGHEKFWKCLNCKTDDNNYIFDKTSNAFHFYVPNNISIGNFFYFNISFKIDIKESLIFFDYLVDQNCYTLIQDKINYTQLNDFEQEKILIDFQNKTNFFVTYNKDYNIPFDTIYFKLSYDENTFTGKVMGYNFETKKYEQLYNNSTFQINEEYKSINCIFSEKEKNNHGAHIKLYIMTYNSPELLNLTKTVSNLGEFEFYFCQEGYSICNSDFYLNCLSEFKCYKNCPIKITSNTQYKCNYCHSECKTCKETIFENDENKFCLSCSSPEKFIKFGNCVSECKNGYYNDTIDPTIKICKCDLINCYKCSLESLKNNNSCITCNEELGYFPLYDDTILHNKINSFKKCYKPPQGYYLDKEDFFYKKCYNSCKKCNISGSELYHNCIECKYNYDYIIQYEIYKNCFINCSYYYYFDEIISQLFCTHGLQCVGKYNKFILGTNQCIDDCKKVSKYKFRKICYSVCPNGSYKSESKSFFCEVICNEEKPFELIENQECVNNCSLNLLKKDLCIIKYVSKQNKNNKKEEIKPKENNSEKEENNSEEKDIKAHDVILENFEIGFTSENYDTVDLDQGQDEIFQNEKMTVTLTTSDNQKHNDNNNYT